MRIDVREAARPQIPAHSPTGRELVAGLLRSLYRAAKRERLRARRARGQR